MRLKNGLRITAPVGLKQLELAENLRPSELYWQLAVNLDHRDQFSPFHTSRATSFIRRRNSTMRSARIASPAAWACPPNRSNKSPHDAIASSKWKPGIDRALPWPIPSSIEITIAGRLIR